MSTTVLIAPLLLVLLSVAVLAMMRRQATTSSAEPGDGATGTFGTATGGLSLAEENRLLRLQVETLTEALHAASEREAAPVAELVPAAEAAVEDGVEDGVEDEVEVDASEETEAVTEPSAVDPARPKVSLVKATPVALVVETLPETVHEVQADDVARHYADLSRCLAGAGRLREAVLAMWAADLRRLAPLVGDRATELYDALGSLAPADAASALTAARAVAAGLVSHDVVLDEVLDDASHLAPVGPTGHTPYTPGEASPDVLPDEVVRALESVLVTAAEQATDAEQLSVGLRCDLVAHVVAGRDRAEVAALVREVLEPHERSSYDVQLGLVGGAA